MDTLTKAKTKVSKTIAAVSEAELTLRLVEAIHGIKRPPGLSAEQALATMPEETQARWQKGARAAMTYWFECIQQMQQAH
ncbi:hypothetical protein BRDID11004_48080 [Bradyrhizobium diazoefficiens]|uniref:Uncharacterized protein n=1 Tax=Bradyrhizobium diazoefficiens TaxID=1355477 RepID=A0A809ZXX0_9BRAD|nr:hypothetical protein [Bradyrhizobium diazoefficiens]BBZ94289.1 hypothetical protein F07S3_41220 [Bradyrhizobium diazoefficiens]BCE56377.1 hypothetical protein XF5B_38890 [Bradyrhizobium diazoefficiens]